MPRILLLSVAPIASDVAAAVDSDTQVTIRTVEAMPSALASAHDWALADLAVLAAGQDAQAESFDAVCLADVGDYGAGALRSVLDIPVVTAGRSAMLYALTLGTRFSMLTTAGSGKRAAKLVHEYGLSAQCASVRACDNADDDGYAAALAAGGLCLAEDGADVLCSTMAAATRFAPQLARALGVPVVEPAALTLKLAESLLGLGLSHSRRTYPEPQIRKAELIRALVAR